MKIKPARCVIVTSVLDPLDLSSLHAFGFWILTFDFRRRPQLLTDSWAARWCIIKNHQSTLSDFAPLANTEFCQKKFLVEGKLFVPLLVQGNPRKLFINLCLVEWIRSYHAGENYQWLPHVDAQHADLDDICQKCDCYSSGQGYISCATSNDEAWNKRILDQDISTSSNQGQHDELFGKEKGGPRIQISDSLQVQGF